jgi:hypothetical protein
MVSTHGTYLAARSVLVYVHCSSATRSASSFVRSKDSAWDRRIYHASSSSSSLK